MAMTQHTQASIYTSFDGHRHLASGAPATVALAVKHALQTGAAGPVLIFDNRTGRSIDVDIRGSDDEVRARLAAHDDAAASTRDETMPADAPRGRGRPRLGVVAREVTLLPRHWDWLAAQPGGASVALRKLVDEARRAHGERDRMRQAQERAYHFMSAMAGDLPGFEEAARALFAGDVSKCEACMADWPADVRKHVLWLASGESDQQG